jgi:hypothetical protein
MVSFAPLSQKRLGKEPPGVPRGASVSAVRTFLCNDLEIR